MVHIISYPRKNYLVQVADIFQDHQDLITEFTNFLPQCHAISIGNHNTPNEHSSSLTKKRRLQSKEVILYIFQNFIHQANIK